MIQGNLTEFETSKVWPVDYVTHNSTTVLAPLPRQKSLISSLIQFNLHKEFFYIAKPDGLPFLERHLSNCKVEICSSDFSTTLGELDPSKAFGCDR